MLRAALISAWVLRSLYLACCRETPRRQSRPATPATIPPQPITFHEPWPAAPPAAIPAEDVTLDELRAQLDGIAPDRIRFDAEGGFWR